MNNTINWWQAALLTAVLAFASSFILLKISFSHEAKANVASKEYVDSNSTIYLVPDV